MATREELRNRLLVIFREEAAEHLTVLEGELQFLRADHESPEARRRIDVLFRTMHTLKGAARSVQVAEIEKICHECELKLREATNRTSAPSRALIEMLSQSLDSLHGCVSELQAGNARRQHEPVTASPAAAQKAPVVTSRTAIEQPAAGIWNVAALVESPPPRKPSSPNDQDVAAPAGPAAGVGRADPFAASLATIRVDIGKLDRLMLSAEDLLLPSLAVSERKRAVRGIMEEVVGLRALIRSKLGGAGSRKAEVAMRDIRSEVLTSLRDVELACRRVTGALAEDERTLRTTVADLYQEMRQARVLPVGAMLAAFPVMVRDLCRETGKRAGWTLNDAGLEIDRKVIDLIKDPLIHLVRNAIDHGIEPPAEREAAGKPIEGRVSVSVIPGDAGRVWIEISDDGRGLDADALRDAAVRSRILSRTQIAALSDSEVFDLAFRSGVSTSAVVTSISGLGLGLSIAREQAERIGGRVTIETSSTAGTRIRLDLPTTIASYRGILVRAGDAKLLFPADAVERVIGIPERQAEATLYSAFLAYGGASLPCTRLASVMGLPAKARSDERHLAPFLVIRNGPRMAVVMVDDVVGEAEVLVKEFPPPLKRVRNVASIGLLATGELAMVLRPSDIVAAVHSGTINVEQQPAADPERPLRLLVVDDSITTRAMERNLFENAGYSVIVAADGLEAWSVLQSEKVDLVVSDVDMPRMNGFELTETIRKDSRLGDLPIVLVTALETRDDKERGVRTGANAYVLKSSFDQSNLLEIVGRLI
jgi:two-component system chemotaxis sensor kinase CheA